MSRATPLRGGLFTGLGLRLVVTNTSFRGAPWGRQFAVRAVARRQSPVASPALAAGALEIPWASHGIAGRYRAPNERRGRRATRDSRLLPESATGRMIPCSKPGGPKPLQRAGGPTLGEQRQTTGSIDECRPRRTLGRGDPLRPHHLGARFACPARCPVSWRRSAVSLPRAQGPKLRSSPAVRPEVRARSIWQNDVAALRDLPSAGRSPRGARARRDASPRLDQRRVAVGRDAR